MDYIYSSLFYVMYASYL